MYRLYKANLLASLSRYTHLRPKAASSWLRVLLVVEGGAISVVIAESRGSNQNKGVGGLSSLEKVSTDSLCPRSKDLLRGVVRWAKGPRGTQAGCLGMRSRELVKVLHADALRKSRSDALEVKI